MYWNLEVHVPIDPCCTSAPIRINKGRKQSRSVKFLNPASRHRIFGFQWGWVVERAEIEGNEKTRNGRHWRDLWAIKASAVTTHYSPRRAHPSPARGGGGNRRPLTRAEAQADPSRRIYLSAGARIFSQPTQ